MKLSLGPIQYFWPRATVYDFYESMKDSEAECIYLGETVCEKRNQLRLGDWLEIANNLSSSGKQVVLSSMAVIESGSELRSLKRLCANSAMLIEANDVAAINLVSEKNMPFVAGPSINIYNAQTLRILYKHGLQRWVMPVELSADTLACIIEDLHTMKIADGIETEVFSFGKLPLAYSARCFTARAKNKAKDECGRACMDYPDGLVLATQEQQNLLTINGIQTQSAAHYNLSNQKRLMEAMGVQYMRLSPQSEGMREIIKQFSDVQSSVQNDDDIEANLSPRPPELIAVEQCNGYWFGKPGMDTVMG